MAHYLLQNMEKSPDHKYASVEQPMLILILFFIAGVLLGIIGLRLLSRWESHGDERPTIFRHHS